MSKLQTKSTLDYLHEYNLKNTPEEVVSTLKECPEVADGCPLRTDPVIEPVK